MPPGLAAAGGQVAFRAPGGLPGASVVAVGAVLLLLLSLVSGSGLMLLLWLHPGLFDVVCVLLCSRRLSVHSVFLVVAGCLGPCLYAPVLALLVRARGLAFCLECAFWGSCRCLRIWINNCPASILIGDLSTR